MTKFDESKLKLRRAFSLEEIKEEDSWVAEDFSTPKGPQDDEEEYEHNLPRRHSFPLTPRSRATVPDP